MKRRNDYVGWLLVLPALALFTALAIVPIAWSVYLSFLRWNGLGRRVFIGLDNYVQMFQDSVFLQSLLNTAEPSMLNSTV